MIKKKDRSLLPYGDSTLAPSFTSTGKEVARWKDDKNKNSDDYFKTKAGEIEAEYNKLKEDFNMNEMINSASIPPITIATHTASSNVTRHSPA